MAKKGRLILPARCIQAKPRPINSVPSIKQNKIAIALCHRYGTNLHGSEPVGVVVVDLLQVVPHAVCSVLQSLHLLFLLLFFLLKQLRQLCLNVILLLFLLFFLRVILLVTVPLCLPVSLRKKHINFELTSLLNDSKLLHKILGGKKQPNFVPFEGNAHGNVCHQGIRREHCFFFFLLLYTKVRVLHIN